MSKTILITGFAPFNGASINVSGEGVNAIDKNTIEERLKVQLRQEILKVKYKHVAEHIPRLWEQHQPCLTIHVGITGRKKGLFLLEKQAMKNGYQSEANNEPEAFKTSCEDQIKTCIDVDDLCKKFNQDLQDQRLKAEVSHDAGRYVCGYTYYKSLCQSRYTLLVHVPQYDYAPEEIARGLEYILEYCVTHGQLQRSETTITRSETTTSRLENVQKEECECCVIL